MLDFLDEILANFQDVLNFIKAIIWDIPQLIITTMLPNLPRSVTGILSALIITFIIITIFKLKKMVI